MRKYIETEVRSVTLYNILKNFPCINKLTRIAIQNEEKRIFSFIFKQKRKKWKEKILLKSNIETNVT